ncbi:MAG: methyltransferase [Nitrospirota bacterium]
MHCDEETLDSILDLKIFQRKHGYRFSVDSLILPYFINLKRLITAVELGAGVCIISMILARRYPHAKIYAVEIQKTLVELGEKNIEFNNLSKQIEIIHADIKDLHSILPEKSFELVLCNPPYRRPKTGLISPEDERAIARHELLMKIDDILDISRYLLRAKGRLALIYHPARLIELMVKMKHYEIEPKRMRFVHSKEGGVAKMVLVEGVKEGKQELKVMPPLYVYNKNGGYSAEMKRIYGVPDAGNALAIHFEAFSFEM